MTVLKKSGANLAFMCPGCKEVHSIGPGWTFNGDFESPTFSPSVLVRSGHYAPHGNGHRCWCDHNRERVEAGEDPSIFKCQTCHSFIRDGYIQFLGDCTHELAGQTVPMIHFEEM